MNIVKNTVNNELLKLFHHWWPVIFLENTVFESPTSHFHQFLRAVMSISDEELSWARHKSARYLRLKNSKRTSKCQVFSFTVPEKPKSWTELVRFGFFNIQSVAKYQKNEGVPFEGKKISKIPQSRKNWNGGPSSLARYCMLRWKKTNNPYISVPCAKWSYLTP